MSRSSNLFDERIQFNRKARDLFLGYALYDSIIEQDLNNVIYLLKYKGADPNFMLDKFGIAPIHCATGIGTEEFGLKCLRLCLKFGGEPNLRTRDGTTPIMVAAIWGRTNILKLLLRCRGNPYLSDNDGKTAFSYATELGNVEVLNIFLRHACSIERHTQFNVTRNQRDANIRKLTNSVDSLNDCIYLSETDFSECEHKNSTRCFSPIINRTNNNGNCSLNIPNTFFTKEMYSDIESEMNFVEIYIPNFNENNVYTETFGVFIDNSIGDLRRVKSESSLYSAQNENSFENNFSYAIKPCSKMSVPAIDNTLLSDSIYSLKEMKSCFNSFKDAVGASFSSGVASLHQNSVSSLGSLSSCPTDYLKAELKKHNLFNGPIIKTTKRVYLRQLKKVEKGMLFVEHKNNGFNELITSTFKSKLNEHIVKWSEIENELIKSIGDFKGLKKGGSEKCCFTYLLLDPFLSDNLPAKQTTLEEHELWHIFVKCIFYVGKGKNSRPHNHLYEAIKAKDNKSLKIQKIQSIWKRGKGIICVNVFHNITSLEAHIREAAMIDALQGGNLTNQQNGEYHGSSKQWSMKKKRQLGVVLLHRAMRVYLAEGERQITSKDLK